MRRSEGRELAKASTAIPGRSSRASIPRTRRAGCREEGYLACRRTASHSASNTGSVRPGGEVRWIWDRGFPVPGIRTGRVSQHVGAAGEITEAPGRSGCSAERALRRARKSGCAFRARRGPGRRVGEVNLGTREGYWSETCTKHAPGPNGEASRSTGDAFLADGPPGRPRGRARGHSARGDRGTHRITDLGTRAVWPDGTVHRISSSRPLLLTTRRVSPQRGARASRSTFTDRHLLEEQLRQSAEDGRESGQLAGGIAHDFNNLADGDPGLRRECWRTASPRPDARRGRRGGDPAWQAGRGGYADDGSCSPSAASWILAVRVAPPGRRRSRPHADAAAAARRGDRSEDHRRRAGPREGRPGADSEQVIVNLRRRTRNDAMRGWRPAHDRQ